MFCRYQDFSDTNSDTWILVHPDTNTEIFIPILIPEDTNILDTEEHLQTWGTFMEDSCSFLPAIPILGYGFLPISIYYKCIFYTDTHTCIAHLFKPLPEYWFILIPIPIVVSLVWIPEDTNTRYYTNTDTRRFVCFWLLIHTTTNTDIQIFIHTVTVMDKYKLGQRQSQTPFSSAFWVQKDFRSKKVLGPKSFKSKRIWVLSPLCVQCTAGEVDGIEHALLKCSKIKPGADFLLETLKSVIPDLTTERIVLYFYGSEINIYIYIYIYHPFLDNVQNSVVFLYGFPYQSNKQDIIKT